MKIERVTALNFIGLRNVDFALNNTLAIFSGHNASGKSSVRDAIRFCLLGKPGRVEKKNEYKSLLSHGARSGNVSVQIDTGNPDMEPAVFSRDVATGKSDQADWEDQYLQFAIDADQFTKLAADDRRSTLFKLLGISATGESVRQLLQARGIHDKYIESVMPLLRSGFPLAHKDAKEQVSQARGAWKSITGETYGAVKADSWQAEFKPVPSNEAAEQIAAEMSAATEEFSNVVEQLRELDQQAAAHGALEGFRDVASLLDDRVKAVNDLNRQIETAHAEAAEAVDRIEAIKKSHNPTTWECPCCGEYLAFDGTALVKAEKPAEMQAEDLEEIDRLESRLRVKSAELADLKANARTAEQKATESRTAAEQIAASNGAEAVDPAAYEELVSARTKLQNTLDEIAYKKREYNTLKQAAEAANRKTALAAQAHTELQAWQQVADAMAPDGIPGELLASAIDQFNKRMVDAYAVTGWPQVQIHSDMTITASGTYYGLLSESEKWRTDAIIAEAIAHFAGLGVLFLDRFDVLDLPNRATALKWLTSISGDYGSILVAGTFKQKPELSDAVDVFWMNGKAEEQNEAA